MKYYVNESDVEKNRNGFYLSDRKRTRKYALSSWYDLGEID